VAPAVGVCRVIAAGARGRRRRGLPCRPQLVSPRSVRQEVAELMTQPTRLDVSAPCVLPGEPIPRFAQPIPRFAQPAQGHYRRRRALSVPAIWRSAPAPQALQSTYQSLAAGCRTRWRRRHRCGTGDGGPALTTSIQAAAVTTTAPMLAPTVAGSDGYSWAQRRPRRGHRSRWRRARAHHPSASRVAVGSLNRLTDRIGRRCAGHAGG
jgi:hypothetical protein